MHSYILALILGLCCVGMVSPVLAQPPTHLEWVIPFSGSSFHTRLHAQTSIPLQGIDLGVLIVNNNGYYDPSITVIVNHQTFVVWHPSDSGYETVSLLSNLNITASMVFDFTIPAILNGNYTFVAWVGAE